MTKYNQNLKNQLFTPTFCFVDIDNCCSPPEFINGDMPTTIVKTPNGYHLYFEDRPISNQFERNRLNTIYGGDKTTKQLYKVGTILNNFKYHIVPNTEE